MQELVSERRHVSLLDNVRIVNRREGGLIEAYVPISTIYREDVPVDDSHVADLRDSIDQESKLNKSSGQLSAIILGEVSGFDKFPIIDGFHRTPALEMLGRSEAFATIRTNCTWEDVFDLRILATSTHRVVKFARVVEWIEEAWKFSPWADRIKAHQAFSLNTAYSSFSGIRTGLDSEDIRQINAYIEDKCKKWRFKPGTLARYLAVSETADPELIKKVRDIKVSEKSNSINSRQLMAIASVLPYDYPLQRLVAGVVQVENLNEGKTRILSALVGQAHSTNEAIRLIDSGVWRSVITVDRRPRKKERDIFGETQELIDKFYDDEIEIARLTIENAILTGRYNPGFKKAIEILPEAQREVLHLRLVEGLSISDTAKALGKLENNVKVLQHKGFQRIQSTSMDEDPVEGTYAPTLEELVLEENPLSRIEAGIVLDLAMIEDITRYVEEVRPALIQYLRSKGFIAEDLAGISSDISIRILTYCLKENLGLASLSGADFRNLVVNVTNSVLLDWTDKNKRGNVFSVSQSTDNNDGKPLLQVISEIENKLQDKDIIKNMLPLLPVSGRRCLVLNIYFNLAPFEISLINGVGLASTRGQLTRTRQILRELMIEDQYK